MKKQGLIIGTNLLLLLVIGALKGGQYIRLSKRLNKYTLEDCGIVASLIEGFEKIYIVSYIATEVSSLIGLRGNAKILNFQVARTPSRLFEEVETDIHEDVSEKGFLDYGLQMPL
ncbi:hypothetical protein [Stutzerimonas degradans]|uniref:hypothetical protein n=1 Tax=Stutzerimonas degradans TaxID=2968968 RepID=UPI0014248665|nr:hypothetical protein [Stutzerimonas degradans]NHW03476.1 hypothetical protein [Stutzerimonas degradans]